MQWIKIIIIVTPIGVKHFTTVHTSDYCCLSGSFLQCSQCNSKISYEDCQNQITAVPCGSNESCFQAAVDVVNTSDSTQETKAFSKGCLQNGRCPDYENGLFEPCSRSSSGLSGFCKGKCCTEDNCNNGNLLANSTGIPTTSRVAAFFISIMVLFSSLLLTM